jgi:hypothetical protein
VNYDLKPDRGGVRLSLRSAEQVRGGTTARVRRPATEAITLPDSARFLRFFFRMWQVSGDRRIALLAVSRKELLEPLTQQFEADPERMCGSLGPQNGGCIALPKEMALNPELKVLANGQTVYVPIGGTLFGVLRSQGVRQFEGVLPRLTVRRPWEGRLLPVEFDRSRADILSLVLIGGEDIRW